MPKAADQLYVILFIYLLANNLSIHPSIVLFIIRMCALILYNTFNANMNEKCPKNLFNKTL